MKPKFEIGDWVETTFNGKIEGVEVAVRKKLLVYGIVLVDVRRFKYYLCEFLGSNPAIPAGKTYELQKAQAK